jgi:hypothetical protein
LRKLRSEILHVNVGSKPHVVGEVVAFVVGILVDDYVVAIPQPIVAEADVEVCHAEVESAEPEAAGDAPAEVPDVPAAESAGEVAVLPGMIEVIVGIAAAGVVADPFVVGVNVGSVGMSSFVAEMAVVLRWMRCAYGRRTVSGNVSSAFMALRERRERKQKAQHEKSDDSLHSKPFSGRPIF